jgi:DNA-binding HxlR family transcriptional regulator
VKQVCISACIKQVRMYSLLMLGRLYESQECAAAGALEEIGERWSLLILRDALFARLTRFSDFQRSLGIATNVLSKRLEGFVDSGILERSEDDPQDYRLTKKGRALKPVVMAMSAWGEKWVRPGRMRYVHIGCPHDGALELAVRCKACDETIKGGAIGVHPKAAS